MLALLGCFGFAILTYAFWLAGRIAQECPVDPKRLPAWDVEGLEARADMSAR